MSENVNHPGHYGGDTQYETIKVIEAWGLGFHLGNAVKYISRAGKKDQMRAGEDIDKAIWYLQRYLESEFEKLKEADALANTKRRADLTGLESVPECDGSPDCGVHQSPPVPYIPPKSVMPMPCPRCISNFGNHTCGLQFTRTDLVHVEDPNEKCGKGCPLWEGG